MRIALFIGHSILNSKENTSAYGIINEYNYLKQLSPYISKELNAIGYECDLMLTPEYMFKKPVEELLYKIPLANKKTAKGHYVYDLVLELHLNYSDDPFKHGIVSYYKTGDRYGSVLADRFCKYYESYNFFNLGTCTPDLFILTETVPTTIVVELYYCSSKIDTTLSNSYGLNLMANIFVSAIKNGIDNTRHGWELQDGKLVYYYESKLCKNEVRNIASKYYYFDKDGYISTGWKEINNNIYYFNPNDSGAMVIDKRMMINGRVYRFDENGILKTSISGKNITRYINFKKTKCIVEESVVIYPDSLSVSEIKSLVESNPNKYLIRNSDYMKYGIKFNDEKYVEGGCYGD